MQSCRKCCVPVHVIILRGDIFVDDVGETVLTHSGVKVFLRRKLLINCTINFVSAAKKLYYKLCF